MKETILLVDDDPKVRDVYTRIMESKGYTVVTEISGGKVLSAIEDNHPNLIILDIMIPEMNGLDVLAAIKENEKISNIPVIMLSALDDEESQKNAIDLGSFKYFVKSSTTTADVMQGVEEALLA